MPFAALTRMKAIVQAFLNVGFIIILFAVGWTVSDFFAGFLISDAGYVIDIPASKAAYALLKVSGFFVTRQRGYSHSRS